MEDIEPEIINSGNYKFMQLILFLIDFTNIAHKLQQLYSRTIQNKYNLIHNYADEFQDRYVMDVKDFARELILDVSQCENCLYILPQLTRDSQCKKGLYRTEKIIVQNYSSCFKSQLTMEVVDTLKDNNQTIQEIRSRPEVQERITDLLGSSQPS